MIAYCGLACDGCPIHLATLEQDPSKRLEMRISIARMCYEHYRMSLQPTDITDCDGCRANIERLFLGCRNCEVRNCAIEKKLDSCAFCYEYPCDKLRRFFDADPDAHARLDDLRKTGRFSDGG